MFEKYLDSMLPVAQNQAAKSLPINYENTLKRFTTAIFFIYRTLSYRYKIESENVEERTLLNITFSITHRKSVTEYFFRMLSVFSIFLLNSEIKEETNRIVLRKIDGYKQYVFELCIVVTSICDWLNEGNKEYEEIARLYKTVALKNVQKSLEIKITADVVHNSLKKLDKAILDLSGFDKSHLQTLIQNNIACLTADRDTNAYDKILWTDNWGYVFLEPYKRNMAVPCTMLYGFNKTNGYFSPDYLYLYDRQKMFPVKPKY